MKKTISFVAILLIVALVVWYLVKINTTKQTQAQEDFVEYSTDSLLFQSVDDESTIVVGDDVILDVINSNQRKAITLHENDGEKTVEVLIPVADDGKSFESVTLVYEVEQEDLELSDVFIQFDGSKYEIIDDFEVLSGFIFYNPVLLFKSNDSIVGFDDFTFSHFIINSDTSYTTHIYSNDKIAIEIVFPVSDSYEDLIGIDSVIFVYKYVQNSTLDRIQANGTKYDIITVVDCAQSDSTLELTDVRIYADTIYEIVHGIDILRHSVEFMMYPILDGCLEKIDPEEDMTL